MDIAVLGLNHRTAPVELRERVAFGEQKLPEAFGAVRGELGLSECVILSTCNRVELYTALPEANGTEGKLKRFLARFHSVEPGLLDTHAYWHLQPDSVRHLFRVAAGLDSMVVGESEILGQVRDAYERAVSAGAVRGTLHRLFQTAIRAGKQARSQTRVGQGAVSVSSVAVELARRIFRDLGSKTILLLGAGQTGESTLTCLKERGVRSILIANRSTEKAVPLAEQVGGRVVPFDRLDLALFDADIVICSTSADRYLLTREEVQGVMAARRQRPLFLIDISVPRNLDPRIGQLENVYLYDIDDLQGIASANLQMRLGEAEECAQIVEKELDKFVNRSPFDRPVLSKADRLRVTGHGELVEP
ncbi:MAG: glutamyl-tRNA reductase [Candidatus Omnitrophica bacterium]|nr:glutamyl-tRNA reductase [Candidatus Omnitrophota bacterium]